MIYITKDQAKKEATEIQGKFTDEIEKLCKKYNVKALFLSVGITVKYQAEGREIGFCTTEGKHEHGMTACVNIQRGAPFELASYLTQLCNTSEEVRAMLETAVTASKAGFIPGKVEAVESSRKHL